MTFAAIGDTPYDIVYLLHIISVIIGTGAAFVVPILVVQMRKAGHDPAPVEQASASVMAPALLAAGVFGGALVGFSDDVYDFSQTWLAIAGPVWILGVVAAAAAYPPSWSPLPDWSDKSAMWSGILHLSLTVMLIVMTFKWGI